MFRLMDTHHQADEIEYVYSCIPVRFRAIKPPMQLWTFSFSSYFHDQPDSGCLLAKTRSWLYLINKSCIWTEYIILLVVNVNCLKRKMKLNIPLIVNFVFTPSCSAPCCRQFLREGTNIPVRRKTICRSCARFCKSAADTRGGCGGGGWGWGKPGTNYRCPNILHRVVFLGSVVTCRCTK